MFSRGKRGLLVVLSLFSAITLVKPGYAHPGCRAGTVALTQSVETIVCPTNLDPLYRYGICCDSVMEAEIILQLEASSATGECAAMYQEVRGASAPLAADLFRLINNG